MQYFLINYLIFLKEVCKNYGKLTEKNPNYNKLGFIIVLLD